MEGYGREKTELRREMNISIQEARSSSDKIKDLV
jgi:hypothetical protein